MMNSPFMTGLPCDDFKANINVVGLSTRHRWWIKQPLAASKQGIFSLELHNISRKLVGFVVFEGTGREPKKTPSLRLPCLALLCGYSIHPCIQIKQGEIS
ncbi:hypothetical protein Q4583_16830 [Neptunomonas phycophila]|uniref:hypothetical protein n=1 Tax=Neptunomonas phycophila TaxID=1572645 RepID=UPI0026E26030|nr:hypothetical protein [Neptunomonas phycophila]MDO6785781.1 hypothetical protein [Neptunomonas phycophila]